MFAGEKTNEKKRGEVLYRSPKCACTSLHIVQHIYYYCDISIYIVCVQMCFGSCRRTSAKNPIRVMYTTII